MFMFKSNFFLKKNENKMVDKKMMKKIMSSILAKVLI